MQQQIRHHYLRLLDSQIKHFQLMGDLLCKSIQLCLTCWLCYQVAKGTMSVGYTDGQTKDLQATVQFPLEGSKMSWDAYSVNWIFVFGAGYCTTLNRWHVYNRLKCWKIPKTTRLLLTWMFFHIQVPCRRPVVVPNCEWGINPFW